MITSTASICPINFLKGERETYHWHGDLAFLESDTIMLPPIDWGNLAIGSRFNVILYSPNSVKDENKQNNRFFSTVPMPLEFPSKFKLKIHTNNFNRARENAFTISNDEGEVHYSGGNFEDDTDYTYVINLDKGCYQFLLSDNMEDGISIHWWNRNSDPEKVGINGSVKFFSMEDYEFYNIQPDFGQELRLNFVIN